MTAINEINELLNRFDPPAKRAWPKPDSKAIYAAIDEKIEKILLSYEADTKHLLIRKPVPAADVDLQIAWKNESKTLEAHFLSAKKELEILKAHIKALLDVREDMLSNYSTALKAYSDALTTAKLSAEPSLIAFAERVDLLSKKTANLREEHDAIVTSLKTMGITESLNDERIEGWDEALRTAYLRLSLAHNGLSGNAPIQLSRPEPPAAIVPTTDRSYNDPFSIWDIAMLVGGTILGFSLGAALNTVSYSTKGWKYQLIFWFILGAGSFISLLVGKMLFPTHVNTIMVETIDCYPYLTDPKDIERNKEHQKKAEKSALVSRLTILGAFCLFITIDFYGMFRGISEQNATKVGDSNAVFMNPWIAGAVLSFMSSLMAMIKITSITSHLKQIKIALQDEIRINTHTFRNAVKRHDDEMIEYEKSVRAAEEYRIKNNKAIINANYRMGEETSPIRERIEKYRIELNNHQLEMGEMPDKDWRVTAEGIITTALATAEPQRLAMTEAERKLDYLHHEVTNATS